LLSNLGVYISGNAKEPASQQYANYVHSRRTSPHTILILRAFDQFFGLFVYKQSPFALLSEIT
jgi:hypothetical protein